VLKSKAMPSEQQKLARYFGKVRPCGAYIQTFAGGWPGTGLLLMRVVAGSALVVRAGLTLRSTKSGPALDPTGAQAAVLSCSTTFL
jgi:hypothetical protein